ncbi:MAG TPA: DUF1844 domain-containing protein [Anaeromyxobacteraceae bacterium]|nr:DUF1844 domain-containing protein [Anaeromyxobacteraceae bacterium]
MAGQEPHVAIDFTTFVLSLGSSALVHMGEVAHPEAQQEQENVALARQTIDILAMLEEKTRGNLTAEESRFLLDLLAELRLRFVERQNRSGPPA